MKIGVVKPKRYVGLITLSFMLASCDYFSVESELYRTVNGLYGETANCMWVASYDEPDEGINRPAFELVDYYKVDDRSCSIDKVIQDKRGFILEPYKCTENIRQMSQTEFTSYTVEPFEIRVEKISKNTIRLEETGKQPRELIQCGSAKN